MIAPPDRARGRGRRRRAGRGFYGSFGRLRKTAENHAVAFETFERRMLDVFVIAEFATPITVRELDGRVLDIGADGEAGRVGKRRLS
ncbi:MAG: hypothetical protein QOD29_4356 [Alphaproteobacteria bacterium]|nr:hypothetical protein [Alphaproteobacteria bacterium]